HAARDAEEAADRARRAEQAERRRAGCRAAAGATDALLAHHAREHLADVPIAHHLREELFVEADALAAPGAVLPVPVDDRQALLLRRREGQAVEEVAERVAVCLPGLLEAQEVTMRDGRGLVVRGLRLPIEPEPMSKRGADGGGLRGVERLVE